MLLVRLQFPLVFGLQVGLADLYQDCGLVAGGHCRIARDLELNRVAFHEGQIQSGQPAEVAVQVTRIPAASYEANEGCVGQHASMIIKHVAFKRNVTDGQRSLEQGERHRIYGMLRV